VVYRESEVKKLKARIAELERALGRKTMDAEILEAAVELAVEKNSSRPVTCPRSEVADEPHRQRMEGFRLSPVSYPEPRP
jgi:hypothetical protein